MTTAKYSLDGRSPYGFRHTAVIVDSEDTVRTRLVPELQRSLRAGQPVFMVVSDHTAGVVRDTLGPDSDRLHWGDQAAFYQRLGFAYEAFRRYLAAQQEAGRRVHAVAEPDITTNLDREAATARATAYLAYESMCNDVYAPYGSDVTCLWDRRRYPPDVLDGARAVHNHELTDNGRTPNPQFLPPETYLAENRHIPFVQPPPTVDQDLRLVDRGQLGLLRTALSIWTDQLGFDTRAAGDIAIAATESAANGLTHGSPPVRVRTWHHRDTLIVQVDDEGGRPIPATAGYRPPDPADTPAGRGLWLARQLADTVTVHTTPARTSVRLTFPRHLTHRHPT